MDMSGQGEVDGIFHKPKKILGLVCGISHTKKRNAPDVGLNPTHKKRSAPGGV